MTDLIQQAGIQLAATASSSEEAVASCGQLLEELGAIEPEYTTAMWQRERIFSSAIGMGFAIPHGTDESRKFVNYDQLVFLRLENSVMWGDELVSCVLGIASKGDAHVDILGNLAELIQDQAHLAILMNSNSPADILDLLLSSQD